MKNERGKRSLANAFLLAFLATASSFAAGDNRFESWQQFSVSQNLDYNLTAIIEGENRLALRPQAWVHTEIDPQLTWRYSPRYDFTAGIECSATKVLGVPQSIGYQPFLETRIKAHSGRRDFQSRQRFQMGTDDGAYVAMFRQLTRLQYRLQGFNDRLSLYIADEWFINLLSGQINENRAFIGTSYALNKAVNLELFGLFQSLSNLGGVSGNIPAIGCKVLFTF